MYSTVASVKESGEIANEHKKNDNTVEKETGTVRERVKRIEENT